MYRRQVINGQEYWVYEPDPAPGTALTPQQQADQQGYADWQRQTYNEQAKNAGGTPAAEGQSAQDAAQAARDAYFGVSYAGWKEMWDEASQSWHWYAQDQSALAAQREAFDKAEKERREKEGRNYTPRQFAGDAPWVDVTGTANGSHAMPGSPDGAGQYADARNYWQYAGAPPKAWFDQQEIDLKNLQNTAGNTDFKAGDAGHDYANFTYAADEAGKYHWYAQDSTANALAKQQWDAAQSLEQKKHANYTPQAYTATAPTVDITGRDYWKLAGAPDQSWFDQQERTRANASLYARTGY